MQDLHGLVILVHNTMIATSLHNNINIHRSWNIPQTIALNQHILKPRTIKGNMVDVFYLILMQREKKRMDINTSFIKLGLRDEEFYH